LLLNARVRPMRRQQSLEQRGRLACPHPPGAPADHAARTSASAFPPIRAGAVAAGS